VREDLERESRGKCPHKLVHHYHHLFTPIFSIVRVERFPTFRSPTNMGAELLRPDELRQGIFLSETKQRMQFNVIPRIQDGKCRVLAKLLKVGLSSKETEMRVSFPRLKNRFVVAAENIRFISQFCVKHACSVSRICIAANTLYTRI